MTLQAESERSVCHRSGKQAREDTNYWSGLGSRVAQARRYLEDHGT